MRRGLRLAVRVARPRNLCRRRLRAFASLLVAALRSWTLMFERRGGGSCLTRRSHAEGCELGKL
jgi:hypothetical protein